MLKTYRVGYIETRSYFLDVNAENEEDAREIADTAIDCGNLSLEEDESFSEGYQYQDTLELKEFDAGAVSIKDVGEDETLTAFMNA